MQWLLIFFIVLICIILLYLFLLTIFARLREKDPVWSGGFLANCNNTCDSPYVCSGGFCLLPEGSTCSTAFDCASSLCSGVCVNGTSGNVGDPCPCVYPAICVGNKCLAGPGSSCSSNEACANNYCLHGSCSSGYPDGFIGCSSDANCASNSCRNGICSNGTDAGLPGSPCSCVIQNVTPCSGGLSCDCTSSLCVVTDISLLSSCDTTHQCRSGLVCSDVCVYSSNPPDGVCPVEFVYNEGCRSKIGYSCRTDGDCSSGSCGGYVMYRYSYTGLQAPTVTSFVAPPYAASKLFTQGEDIYAVTSNGLYRYDNDWRQVTAANADGRYLVDVTTNGNVFYGLFEDGYLYRNSSGGEWAYVTRFNVSNGKYIESNASSNILLTSYDNKVYSGSISGTTTGNLTYSSYGVTTPVNSMYYRSPVRFYEAGIVNPNGIQPSLCPADFRYRNVVNCPSNKNFAFLGNQGQLYYQGAYSGIVQPENTTGAIDFAFLPDPQGEGGYVAITFPTGLYFGQNNLGFLYPAYLTDESVVTMRSTSSTVDVYVVTKSCG